MSAFTTPLDVRHIDGRIWRVLEAFCFRVGGVDSKEIITVAAGAITDFASIPRLLWWLIGHPTGKYGKAAVTHDEVYRHPANGIDAPRSRRRCDQIFLEGMEVLGVAWWRRSAMYSGVRIGGWRAWNKYRAEERAAREIVAGIRKKYKDMA